MGGPHARIRTGDLFLTKEVVVDQFPTGALLRSNAEAISNNRCLAALPTKSTRRLEMNAWDHPGAAIGRSKGERDSGL